MKMLMRIWCGALLAFMLFVVGVSAEPQQGRIITITAGTAIRLILNPTTVKPVLANSMLIQVQHAGSGLVYVLNANPQQTCALGNATTTEVAELAPATSTEPGGSFTFPSNGSATNGSSGFDVRYWCVDGSNSGDTVIVSWDVRN